VESTYWQDVMAADYAVPRDRALTDLTEELVRGLASTNPQVRDALAYPTLATWLERGVYDDLLPGFGDGLCAGLNYGLGEDGTDTVFRRSFTALTLAEVIHRDNAEFLVHDEVVMRWGDRLATWLLRERDLRGFVPGNGWAHAVAHGADALGTLAESPHLSTNELTVVLDVIADRLLLPVDRLFTAGEPDRLALATMKVLRRNRVPLRVLEPWIARLAAAAAPRSMHDDRDPYLAGGNAEAFLRSLYLQLSLGPLPPEVRSDLLLVVVDALKATNPHYLRPTSR
jgi:hypothetical protein